MSGATAAGVTVALSGASSATATTDGNGNYAFTGLSNGSYTVTPSKAGYAFSPLGISMFVNGADRTGNDFTARLTYSISGNVSGATQALVTMTLTSAASRSTTTDANGNYTFTDLSNGSYTLTPSKGGEYTFLPVTRDVIVNDGNVTGQDFTALDAEWANWPIPADSPGISSYTIDAAAGTVTDNLTGLVWQRSVDANSYSWAGARSYCQSLSLGGWSTGWRVPTLIELESIVDYGTYNPAINGTAFPGTPTTSSTWSSSPYASDASQAWAVGFYGGNTGPSDAFRSNRVRCVR